MTLSYIENIPGNIFNGHKIHLITYGCEKYNLKKQRLFNQAVNSNFFYSITIYNKENLTNGFKEKFSDVLSLSRGDGYWIWKFDIIKRNLENMNNDDILVYVDAGVTINKNGENRLLEYINLLKKNKARFISTQMEHIERVYTSQSLFDYFKLDINSDIATSGQYMAKILIMEKSALEIINKCIDVINNDKYLITDKYNNINRNKYFHDNRHDQSILSIIRKMYNTIIIPEDGKTSGTFFFNWGCEAARKEPFLSTR